MEKKIIQTLSEWILRITENEMASPAEIAALPEIAKIVLAYPSDCDLDVSES